MSFQEKKSIAYLISIIVAYTSYYFVVIIAPENWGYIADSNDYSFWAAAILMLIPTQIVANVIIHIIFVIINTVTSDDKDPEFEDELDKLIELKTIRNSMYAFTTGFFTAMILLAFGFSITIMFITFFFTFFLTGISGEITKIYFYRKGF